jgi:hypothetical protein
MRSSCDSGGKYMDERLTYDYESEESANIRQRLLLYDEMNKKNEEKKRREREMEE